MANGKRFYRRRRAPKRRLYRKRRGLGVKSVKAIARTVVEQGRETKSLQQEILNYSIYSYATGNAGGIDTAPVFSLTPNTVVTFPQGLGALSKGTGQGNRIGNQVEFTKGTLRMMLSCNPYDATTNPSPQPIIAKIFVGYDRTQGYGMPQPGLPDFFQDGSSTRNPTGTLLDMFSVVNTDRYVICYTRTVKIGYAEYFGFPAASGSSIPQFYQYYTNNDYKLNPVVNINFSKKMIHRAKFGDLSNTLKQRGTYCWILTSPTTYGSTMIGTPLAITCQINNEFKDA